MEIVVGKDNAILRKKSDPVVIFDKKLQKLVKEMEDAVKKAEGVGIAAPQVGINQRLFLVKMKRRFVLMVNPEITSFSYDTIVMEEGCLSLPGQWGMVRRPKDILVSFQDISGKQMKLELSGIESRIVQHELDHLDGILFIDKLEKQDINQDHNPLIA